jgi:hypothetical protein
LVSEQRVEKMLGQARAFLAVKLLGCHGGVWPGHEVISVAGARRIADTATSLVVSQ